MIATKTLVLAAIIAYVEARFGQEQLPIQAINDVQGGEGGAAATIAGAAISDLLGAANACDKLTRADQIVSELGGGADAIAAAIGMVTAEKNTNPFANGNVQNVCADPTLPATAELRGITPLIDPDVDVNGDVNALSAQTAAAPLNADGLSVFDLISQAGFGDIVAGQDAAGGAVAAGGAAAADGAAANDNANAGNNNNNQADDAAADDAAAGNNNANAGNNNNNNNNQADDAAADDAAADDAAAGNNNANAGNNNNNNNQADDAAADDAAAGNNNANAGNNNNNNQADDAAADDAAADDAAANDDADAGNNNQAADAATGAATGSVDGADFGLCTPTITFQGGEGNRPADEFTFQIADPIARGGQSEALNPDIITNALCDSLANNCEANDAAIALCLDGKAQVTALGTRDKATADLFNSVVGFAGAVTNPDGGPDDVDAAAAARRALGLRALKFRA